MLEYDKFSHTGFNARILISEPGKKSRTCEISYFISSATRRRFLFECPKNTIRNYNPPKLNKVSLSSDYKHFDDQLHDIQYRLSGLTRPTDCFLYQMSLGNWSPEQLRAQTQDFVHSLHELLSDLVSNVTNMRTKNFYKGLPSKSEPPLPSSEDLLVDPKDMLEHLKLQQQVQNATQLHKRKNGPRPKRKNDDRTTVSQANTSGTTSHNTSSTNSSASSGNPVPQPSTSKGFQQRLQQKRNI